MLLTRHGEFHGQVKFPFDIARMPRTLAFARQHQLSFAEVFAVLLRRLTRPRPWLEELLRTVPSHDLGLHVRRSEFTGDARAPVPVSDFVLEAQAKAGKRFAERVIYVASDVANVTTQLRAELRGDRQQQPRFVAYRGARADTVCNTQTRQRCSAVEKLVKAADAETVRRLTAHALIDLLVLASAPEYLGSVGNWASLVLLLRLARSRTQFARSTYLSRYKAAYQGATLTWTAESCLAETHTVTCRLDKRCRLLPLWNGAQAAGACEDSTASSGPTPDGGETSMPTKARLNPRGPAFESRHFVPNITSAVATAVSTPSSCVPAGAVAVTYFSRATTEMRRFQFARLRQQPCFLTRLVSVSFGAGSGFGVTVHAPAPATPERHTLGYMILKWAKWRLLRDALSAATGVLYLEADVLLLRNPFDAIPNEPRFDVRFQTQAYCETVLSDPQCPLAPRYEAREASLPANFSECSLNGGVIWLRSAAMARRVVSMEPDWTEVEGKMSRQGSLRTSLQLDLSQGGVLDEQAAADRVARSGDFSFCPLSSYHFSSGCIVSSKRFVREWVHACGTHAYHCNCMPERLTVMQAVLKHVQSRVTGGFDGQCPLDAEPPQTPQEAPVAETVQGVQLHDAHAWGPASSARPLWEAYLRMHQQEQAGWRLQSLANSAVVRSSEATGASRQPCLIFLVREVTSWSVLQSANNRLSGGFADRTTGLISAFALALLANATFLVDWPDLGKLFSSPLGLEWNCPGCGDVALRRSGAQSLVFPFQAGADPEQVLASVAVPSRVTVLRGAQGILHRLVDSRVLGPRMAALGLTLSSAFRELHAALFAPKLALLSRYQPLLRAVQGAPSSVLLQIRVGDRNVMGRETALVRSMRAGMKTGATPERESSSNETTSLRRDAVKIEDYAYYFACARAFAKDALIFLMTDSPMIRTRASKAFGRSVLVPTAEPKASTPVGHFAYSQDSLASVVIEVMVARHCDFHIITEKSGLGIQAFFLSDRVDPRRLRLIPGCTSIADKKPKQQRTLQNAAEGPIGWLATRWSRI